MCPLAWLHCCTLSIPNIVTITYFGSGVKPYTLDFLSSGHGRYWTVLNLVYIRSCGMNPTFRDYAGEAQPRDEKRGWGGAVECAYYNRGRVIPLTLEHFLNEYRRRDINGQQMLKGVSKEAALAQEHKDGWNSS